MPDNMRPERRGGFRFTLRVKLLLLSIVVLGIPYLGYEYLRELEQRLRSSLEQSLGDAARTISGVMHENYVLFPRVEVDPAPSLFIHTLDAPVQIDGYSEDWINFLDWADDYPHAVAQAAGGPPGPAFRLSLAQDDQYLYALLQVRDEHIIYHQPTSAQTLDSDYVELVLGNDYQVQNRYYFLPSAPGRFNPIQIETIAGDWESRDYIRYITNIAADWQPVAGGYHLEISLPLSLLQERMGFIVGDRAEDGAQAVRVTGTAGPDTGDRPGRLIFPSNQITQVIKRNQTAGGRRIWVLDTHGQVLASAGSLQRETAAHPLNIIYKLLLPSVSGKFKDDLAGASRLRGREIQDALEGHTGFRWRQSPDRKAVIVSAAAPIWLEDRVAGAVMVEETTNNIQLLQRNAMVSLINKTMVAFVVITAALLGFATRLSQRLRRLSREAAAAIDEHGRVTGHMSVSAATDEIGDLSRSYAAMLERLRQYNRYLESLAGKLSHELRTPMAVVQSSLENLQTAAPADSPVYVERAQEAMHRLQVLVTRLSEAARLEQALQGAVREPVALGSLLDRTVAGYRSAYPAREFHLTLPDAEIVLDISPELFLQMLDKIVGNAVDFSDAGKPIEITLARSGPDVGLAVANRGALLPESMPGGLFNSMVSVRGPGKQGEPHLGLGLYIARMIAEYHGGRIRAENLPGRDGVCFTLSFPAP